MVFSKNKFLFFYCFSLLVSISLFLFGALLFPFISDLIYPVSNSQGRSWWCRFKIFLFPNKELVDKFPSDYCLSDILESSQILFSFYFIYTMLYFPFDIFFEPWVIEGCSFPHIWDYFRMILLWLLIWLRVVIEHILPGLNIFKVIKTYMMTWNIIHFHKCSTYTWKNACFDVSRWSLF